MLEGARLGKALCQSQMAGIMSAPADAHFGQNLWNNLERQLKLEVR